MAAPLKYNRYVAIVRAVADPEIQTFGSGATKTKVRAVIPESRKDKSTGQWVDTPVWLDLEAWNRGNYTLAENLANQVRKGSQFLVEGSLKCEEWTDKASGAKRSKLIVVLENYVLLTASQSVSALPPASDDSDGGSGGGSAPADSDDIPF